MAVSKEQLQTERHAIESQFATENWWSQMSFNDRLEACRALEQNYAAEKGVAPCEVTYEFMDGSTYGYQCNGKITLNAYVLDEGNFHALIRDENGLVMTDDNGRPMEAVVPVRGSNWATMETVYHEGTHGVQEAEGRLATTYIGSQEDYALYRIQSCEREAFATGQLRTLEAIQQYQNSTGKMDSEAVNYARSVQANSYRQYHDEAAARYHDSNIDQTVDQYIADQDNGIVPDNPSESYEAVAQVHQEGLQRLETVSEDQTSEYLGSPESGPTNQTGFDYVGLSEDSGLSTGDISPSFDYVGLSEDSGLNSGEISPSFDYVGLSEDSGLSSGEISPSFDYVGLSEDSGLSSGEISPSFDYVGLSEDSGLNSGEISPSFDYVGLSENSGLSSGEISPSMDYGSQESAGAEAGIE